MPRSAIPVLCASILAACQAEGDDDGVGGTDPGVPWSGGLTPTDRALSPVRGQVTRRGIVHLHSPFSHDACDGAGFVDGLFDESCLVDLRGALCTTAMDFAYVTDHPSYAAYQDYADLLEQREGDEGVGADGEPNDDPIASRLSCDNGHTVLWLPGIEVELMPIGLERHVADQPEDADRIYNQYDADAVAADTDAGALVFQAHTEGKDPDTVEALFDGGLVGVEVFNLHAMFAPDIRQDDLGLDPLGWLADIAPFTAQDPVAEPDLLLLALLEAQTPSLATFDRLAAAPADGARMPVAVAGTDAHQNTIPTLLADGERGDSYRRMLRWFSNHVRTADGAELTPDALDRALAAGHTYVAFELLGTPDGFDFWLEDAAGERWEMGSVAPPGTLHVGCPTLSRTSPRGADAPEIAVTVLRDSEPWAEGCGDFDVVDPASAATFRVEVSITPWHLADYLGDDPSPWLHPYPWVYGNPIRIDPSR